MGVSPAFQSNRERKKIILELKTFSYLLSQAVYLLIQHVDQHRILRVISLDLDDLLLRPNAVVYVLSERKIRIICFESQF